MSPNHTPQPGSLLASLLAHLQRSADPAIARWAGQMQTEGEFYELSNEQPRTNDNRTTRTGRGAHTAGTAQ